MIRQGLLLLLLLSGCADPAKIPAISPESPAFLPIAFFSGHTEGRGRLKIVMSRARSVRIEGDGNVAPDGTLTLVQHIAQDGKPARSRQWSLKATGPDTYRAQLSDAVGPVATDIEGNVMHIRFKAKGGLGIEQWLALQPNGRSALNHLVVRKFGMRVAVFNESIRKID